MANIRTLKLNLLADTTDFAKGIKKASGQTSTFASDVARNIKIATTAAAGFAVAFGVSAVKAAIDDQKSQKQLSIALKNTTKATDRQVASTENWITAQQFAYGIADDKLRPALAKLVRVTGDVKKSQDLLKLALDVSAGSGKSLEAVTNAITRAQQGNLAGLKKLGVPLSDTIIKNKDLAAALKITEDRFKGAAAQGADTLSGRMAILKQRINEAKESIGTAILTGLQPLADKWLPKISTGVTHFVDGLTGANGLKSALKDNQDNLFYLGQKARDFFKLLADNKGTLAKVAAVMAGIFLGAKAGIAIQGVITAIRSLIGVYELLTGAAALAAGAEAAATGGASFYAALPAIGAIAGAFGVAALVGLGSGKQFTPGQIKSSSSVGKELQKTGVGAGTFGGTQYGTALENSGGNGWGGGARGPRSFRQSSSNNVTINVNGVIDGESARRSIERVLQQSSVRTGDLRLSGTLI